MRITNNRLLEMQRQLIQLESDLWRDLNEAKTKGIEVPEQWETRYREARRALLETWGKLEDIIAPWEE